MLGANRCTWRFSGPRLRLTPASGKVSDSPLLGVTTPFPPALAANAPPFWRFCRNFSLEYARKHARRGNRAGASGQVAKAIMEEAHAVLCEQRRWACNEKRLIEDAGLAALHGRFDRIPDSQKSLVAWVDGIATALGVGPGEIPPWSDRA